MPTISLVLLGKGPVPSFKNRKRIMRGKLVTDPKVKKWMNLCIEHLRSQLNSDIRTFGDGTWTERAAQSLIASLPPDDCWLWIRELHVTAKHVPKGAEGAKITIERIY